jgi:enterochelin esterase-like enzyme
MRKISNAILAIVLLATAGSAQRGAPALRSPEVLPDHRVTFRIDFQKVLADSKKVNDQLKLLWIGSGTEDTLFNSIRAFDKQLTDLGIKHTLKANEGAHTWLVWRRYLNEVAPLLFP